MASTDKGTVIDVIRSEPVDYAPVEYSLVFVVGNRGKVVLVGCPNAGGYLYR